MTRWTNTRGASPLLIILAVLLVGAFLFWLNLQAQGVEDDVEPVTEEEEAGEAIEFIPAQLVEAPETLMGEEGVMRNVGVSQRLGRGVVVVDLDGENAYPVLLSPDVIAGGANLSSGQRITVYGRMYTLNDSIRGAWVEREAVDQGSANAIPETTSFVLADSLTFN